MPQLPQANTTGQTSIEQTLSTRRSCRSYRNEPLSMEQISQILWSGQGITKASRNFRTAPSAGATFPLTLYAVLPDGVYRYDPAGQQIAQTLNGDVRENLAEACLKQTWMIPAGLIVVIAAEFSRTTERYGGRGERYVWMEVGHAAENIFLQAEAMSLGSVAIGAYDDESVAKVIKLPNNEEPCLLVAVGVKGKST